MTACLSGVNVAAVGERSYAHLIATLQQQAGPQLRSLHMAGISEMTLRRPKLNCPGLKPYVRNGCVPWMSPSDCGWMQVALLKEDNNKLREKNRVLEDEVRRATNYSDPGAD